MASLRLIVGLGLAAAVGITLRQVDAVSLLRDELLPLAQSWKASSPLEAAAAAVAVTIFWILSLLPLTPIEVAIGFVFGVKVGYVVCFLGKVLGCTLAFLLGRTLLHDWAQRQFGKNDLLGAIDLAIRKRPYRIATIVRLAYIPVSLKNFGLALVSVEPQVFVASLVGVEVFNSWIWVIVGSTAQDFGALLSGKQPASPMQMGVMSFGCVCLFGLMVYMSKATSEALKEVREAKQKESDEKSQ